MASPSRHGPALRPCRQGQPLQKLLGLLIGKFQTLPGLPAVISTKSKRMGRHPVLAGLVGNFAGITTGQRAARQFHRPVFPAAVLPQEPAGAKLANLFSTDH